MTRTQTVQYLPFILTYLAQITLFPRSRPICSASISLSLQFLYFASLPFLQRNAPCIFRMHHTRSYFQLCDKKYVYNGKQNKVNTIRFCVRPWYCDTDNRLPCFVFRAFYPITLWIIPDKSRTFNPAAAAAAAAIRGHETDWQHSVPQSLVYQKRQMSPSERCYLHTPHCGSNAAHIQL